MKVEILHTNGDNKDIEFLSEILDKELDEIIGAELRQKYHVDNSLDVIRNAFLAYVDGELAACASFKEKDDAVELKRVYTLPEHRGKGIAKKLMEEVESEAKKQGYKRVILETSEKLQGAIKMYEKMGYEIIPNFPPYEESIISVCMGKDL